jgi:hypothetical protein
VSRRQREAIHSYLKHEGGGNVMKIDHTARRGLAAGVFLSCLGLALSAGCGNESTQPKPEVKAMGGIVLARGMPVGTPYEAGVVVSVNGQIVNDAVVRISGAELAYVINPAKPEATGYVGQVSASPGDVLTLSVTAAGQTVTLQATVPGMVEIHPLAGGMVYADNQNIPISWVPATGAMFGMVTCAGASSTTPGIWMVAPTATEYTIPASATTVPGSRISVLGLSGSGDLPTSMDLRQWAGKNGFWLTSEDYVDVMITD